LTSIKATLTKSVVASRRSQKRLLFGNSETDKEIKITAELSGLQEKDVQLNLADNVLAIRGEKKNEREEGPGLPPCRKQPWLVHTIHLSLGPAAIEPDRDRRRYWPVRVTHASFDGSSAGLNRAPQSNRTRRQMIESDHFKHRLPRKRSEADVRQIPTREEIPSLMRQPAAKSAGHRRVARLLQESSLPRLCRAGIWREKAVMELSWS
jgi:Hsp20/alpha crystallin family